MTKPEVWNFPFFFLRVINNSQSTCLFPPGDSTLLWYHLKKGERLQILNFSITLPLPQPTPLKIMISSGQPNKNSNSILLVADICIAQEGFLPQPATADLSICRHLCALTGHNIKFYKIGWEGVKESVVISRNPLFSTVLSSHSNPIRVTVPWHNVAINFLWTIH